jgi:HEAT repeat protein
MDTERLRQVLRQPEPEHLKLDFKRKLYAIDHCDPKVRDMQWDEFIKDILALGNGNVGTACQMGYLVIGIADELNQYGTRDLYDVGDVKLTEQRILQKVNSACRPRLPSISCDMITLEGNRILIITIPPTPYLHETIRPLRTPKAVYPENTVFIRRKGDIGLADTAERQAILAEKQAVFLQASPPERPHIGQLRLTAAVIQVHRKLLAAKPKYARWGDKPADESYIHSIGVHLPLYASPYQDIGGSSEELLQCIHSHTRLLILGEPGMGKTVALERATWEFSTATTITIPILVPLIQYDGDLMKTVVTALNETGVLNVTSATEVEQLSLNFRCVFLFDGLNEVTGSQRDRLYSELASFLHAHPFCPCIITSRSQDNLWRRFHTREMIEDAVVVRRITDDQIAEYLAAHLGARKGRELYDRLNEALRGLARIPLLLWLIKEAGIAGEELPGNRGELFDRFVRQLLKREQKHPDLATISLHRKMQALSHLAFHLQRDHRLACSRDEAIHVVQESYSGIDGTRVIQESLQNGLIVGETRLHFMHQAVHEFFTALRVRTLVSSLEISEKQAITRLKAYPSVITLRRNLRKWAKEDWWAEVIVQLAGIVEQPMFVAKQVLRSNPWLAYWCSIEGQPLSAEMQAQIERQTVARLDSPKLEDRLRVVSELARMENPRTIDYLIAALGDAATPVQELASHTLARLGEPSVDPLLDSLTSATERARWAATRTLGTIWRFPSIVNLGADDSLPRHRAAKVLGKVGDNRAVLPLSAALDDTDEGIRIEAAQSLGMLRDDRAVAPLMRALERTYIEGRPHESAVVANALASLGKPTDEPLFAGLNDSDIAVRQRALIALGRTWMLPAVAELASPNPETRRDAAKKLGELSDERVAKPLLATLKDPDQSVRWEATKALGCLWQLPDLIGLGDVNTEARIAAARALGTSPDARVVEPLIAALRDRDWRVQWRAADALAAFGEIAIEPLASLLTYKEREIRRSVGRALAGIEDDKVADILASALQDERPWVREAAADSLVKLGDRGVPVLEMALRSDNSNIRQLARVALRRIGTIRSQAALRFGSAWHTDISDNT